MKYLKKNKKWSYELVVISVAHIYFKSVFDEFCLGRFFRFNDTELIYGIDPYY